MSKRASFVATELCSKCLSANAVQSICNYLSSLPEFSDQVLTALWKDLRAREAELKRRVDKDMKKCQDSGDHERSANRAAYNEFENTIEILLRHIVNPIEEESNLVQCIRYENADTPMFSREDFIAFVRRYEQEKNK